MQPLIDIKLPEKELDVHDYTVNDLVIRFKGYKTTRITKGFSSLIKDKQEENLLLSQGLPPEISGMSVDDAIDFLKDELDIAGDQLGINATPKAYDRYKKAVGQFVKFLEKNNYTVERHKRFGRNRKGRPLGKFFKIHIQDFCQELCS